MTVVADVEIAAGEFPLGRVLTWDLDVEVRLEPIVPLTDRTASYVRVDGRDADAFEDHVSTTDAVDSVVELERADGSTLYRVDWREYPECPTAGLRDSEATVLDAHGGDRWCFKIRFPSREALSAFHSYCAELDVPLSLVRIGSGDDTPSDRLELTPEQRRAIELATERGYFEIPREVTLSELAEELGITSQAVSERIRRGTETVFRSVIGDDRLE